MQSLSLNLTGNDKPELLNSARVSANVFGVLRVRPQLGRTFHEDEDPAGHDSVVILTDRLWRRRFNSDPAIIGAKVLLDGRPFQLRSIVAEYERVVKKSG